MGFETSTTESEGSVTMNEVIFCVKLPSNQRILEIIVYQGGKYPRGNNKLRNKNKED